MYWNKKNRTVPAETFLNWVSQTIEIKVLAGRLLTELIGRLQFLNCRNFDFLIPDAPELIGGFLDGEQDMSCKRNAFMMLIQVDQVRH